MLNQTLKEYFLLGHCMTSKIHNYIHQNYLETANALGLGRDQLIQLARNSIEAAFTTDSERRSDLARLATYCTEH